MVLPASRVMTAFLFKGGVSFGVDTEIDVCQDTLMWSNCVLQRCHPYGVKEETGQKSGENLPHKRRQGSNAKTLHTRLFKI